jgi:hypothetical protein
LHNEDLELFTAEHENMQRGKLKYGEETWHWQQQTHNLALAAADT